MMLGPAFKGQVVIMESLSLPPSSSQSLPEMKQSEAPKMPEGLRQRFKPFGCGKLKRKSFINHGIKMNLLSVCRLVESETVFHSENHVFPIVI